MRSKIWIVNHYATNMYFDKCGRHYGLTKYLDKQKYDLTIVCADKSYLNDKSIHIEKTYKIIEDDGISWCFIKTSNFQGNGVKRIRNMFGFYRGLCNLIKKEDKPDIIIGSNVHLLACLFSVKMKKKYGIKSIVEMRDLWPECFIGSKLGKISPLMRSLYIFERYLYRNADAIICTLEGIQDYISVRHKKAKILEDKIFYINNGVDLEQFNNEKKEFYESEVLDSDKIKILYTGTINFANGIQHIIALGKAIMNICNDVEIYVFGSGNYKDYFLDVLEKENISNIKYMGRIERKSIPFLLEQADYLLLNYGNQSMFKWGESQNKLFEYMAANKPILSNVITPYDIVKRNGLGMYYDANSKESVDEVVNFIHMDKVVYSQYCENSRRCVQDFDYVILAKKLEIVFEYVKTCEGEE